MLTNLQQHPELFEQTITLIEKSFGYQKGESFKKDFYPLIEKDNSHQNFIFRENGEVIGHAGVKVRFLGNSQFCLKVALIGGVAVAETHRRKGILTKLFQNIFENFDESVGLYILWGDAGDIYKKFGFFHAGVVFESLGSKNPGFEKRFTKTKFKNLNIEELTQIKKIYQEFTLKKYFSFLRSEKDWENIKNIDSCDLYILKNRDERIVGYFCQNKGMDLNGIVHEYGFLGEAEDSLFELLKAFKTWSPAHPFKEITEKILYQGLFRKGNLDLLNQFLNIRSQGFLKILRWERSEVRFLIGKKIVCIQEESFFEYIFGTLLPKDIGFPLFFSGLDSV
ncbi:MAG: GNAT family N-acetyltransferase [Bacteriovoracales bacterium]